MNPSISAALILAAAIVFYALAGRYELTPSYKVVVYRLDKLTGTVSMCRPTSCTKAVEKD